jgi:hypothetical protein
MAENITVDWFRGIILKHLDFLATDYGMTLHYTSQSPERPLCAFDYTFKGGNVAVNIDHEVKDSQLSIRVFGPFQKLLHVRHLTELDPPDRRLPYRIVRTSEEIESYLKELADLLRRHGAPFLKGDFSSLNPSWK